MLQTLPWTQQMLQELHPGLILTLTVISSSRSLQPLAQNDVEPGSNTAAAAPEALHHSSRCTRLLQQHRAVTAVVMVTVTAAVPLAALVAVRRMVLPLTTQQIQTSSPKRMRQRLVVAGAVL